MKSSELSNGENRIALRQLLQNRKLRHLWRHNLGSRWKLQKKWLERILVLVRESQDVTASPADVRCWSKRCGDSFSFECAFSDRLDSTGEVAVYVFSPGESHCCKLYHPSADSFTEVQSSGRATRKAVLRKIYRNVASARNMEGWTIHKAMR